MRNINPCALIVLAVGFTCQALAQTPDITSGLVAYFPFSGNANDASGNGNHGSPGTAQLSPDRFGRAQSAYTFNGVDSVITTARPPTANVENVSMFCWIKPNKLPQWGMALSLGTATGGGTAPCNGYSLGIGDAISTTTLQGARLTAANACVAWIDGGYVFASTLEWHHVGLVRQAGRNDFFVDGRLVASRAIAAPSPPTQFAIGTMLGSDRTISAFNGSIDDVRIYNRALSALDIAYLFASETTSARPVIAVHPVAATAVEGERTSLTVLAIGSAPLAYRWTRDGMVIAGATTASLLFERVQASDAGIYAVTVSNAAGVVTSDSVVLTVKSANPGRLANLSIRTEAGTGNSTLIVGFSLGGSAALGTTPVLTRASGPALAQFGVSGTLPDPFLSVYEAGRLLGSNDNWTGLDAIRVAAMTAGAFAFPPESKDAAMLSSLSGSSFTAQAFDVGGAYGVVLLEVYDTSPSFSYSRPRLINLSARANTGAGGSTMIAGFFVKGVTPLTVLIRGVGPSLTRFGVAGVLPNPHLTLFSDSGLVAVNEDWGDLGASSIASTANAVGAFALPSGSLDAAILATLQPGAYTVQVSGGTGVALIEVYEVP